MNVQETWKGSNYAYSSSWTADRLRQEVEKIRTQDLLTVSQIGRIIGLSDTTIYGMMAGKRRIRLCVELGFKYIEEVGGATEALRRAKDPALAAELKEWTIRHGIPVRQLARLCGVGDDTVRQWVYPHRTVGRPPRRPPPWLSSVLDMILQRGDAKKRTLENPPEGWITMSEAARRLGVSRQSVYTWVEKAKLPTIIARVPESKRMMGAGKVVEWEPLRKYAARRGARSRLPKE